MVDAGTTPFVLLTGVTENVLPLQIEAVILVIAATGFIVKLKA